VDLADNNGVTGTCALYGITIPGVHVLTADLSTTPNLNIADTQHLHLECDPGSAATIMYDLTFENLAFVTPVTEPTSLALVGLGALGLFIARRRAR
jgi:PEP-CTERM motif